MQIILPKKPQVVSKDSYKAVIEIENLYPGYGMTLGNALRRVLLSSLEGAAVTLVKIKNVSHEFSTLPGVLEDVVEILLNIKKLRFVLHSDEPQIATIKVQGEKNVSAKDIKTPTQVSVISTDAHIATLTDKKAVFEIEMTVEKGFGYVPVENRKKDKLEIGTIALDAIFTPMRKINYEVENMRVGERTDFDRLRFFIETDGTIDPEEAFVKSAGILVEQFKQLIGVEDANQRLQFDTVKVARADEAEDQSADSHDDVLKTKISDLNLSSRVAHALEEGGIKTVAGLVKKTEHDILELGGIGDKGISDIKKALKKLHCSLKEA